MEKRQTMIALKNLPTKFCKELEALFSDIDDTLTISGKMPAYIIDALYDLHDADIKVFFVTGRPCAFGVALENYFGFLSGVITENGGALCANGQIEILPKIEDLNSYRTDLESVFSKLCERFGRLEVSVGNEFRLTDFAINRSDIDDKTVLEIVEYARNLGVDAVYSSIQIHFFKHKMDKGKAVRAVCAKYKIDKNKIVTLGDSPNDESLFEFDYSVGVANVTRSISRLNVLPKFVATKPYAEGALELVREILSKRKKI